MDPNEDVMADIRAAMNPEPAEPVAQPEPIVVEELISAAPEAEKPAGERERGPDGKFVAKAEEPAQDTTNQPPKAAETPQESIRPPASWSAVAKSKFAALDPDIQKEVLKREQDVEKGFRERADALKRYEPLDQVLEPRRALWAAQGMDEVQAVKTLLAAQDLLEKNPQQGIEYLAKAYGVSLNAAQPTEGQANTPQPDGNSPRIDQLMQRIDQLTQQVQQAQTAPVTDQIEQFRNDPANLYFDNVRPAMAALIQSGQAKTLPEAYEMACWMDPTIRVLMQKPQVAPAADTARVEKAKAAGASVTGSPSSAPIVAGAGNSVEDDIRRSFQELAGRA